MKNTNIDWTNHDFKEENEINPSALVVVGMVMIFCFFLLALGVIYAIKLLGWWIPVLMGICVMFYFCYLALKFMQE